MTLAAVEIPEVETPRLRLRAPAPADFEAVAGFLASDRAAFVGGPLGRLAAWETLAGRIGHWLWRGFGMWSVEDRASGAYVGHVGAWFPPDWPEPEIGWCLVAAAEGKGYAEEAARAARAHLYGALGWRTAISLIHPDNARSRALARRLGCACEGVFAHPDGWSADLWRHPAPAGAAR